MRQGQGKNLQQAKKRNIEIINNLKQTLSKPTIVQAQRTLKILQRLIDRIGIFLNLDSDFLVKFNEVNNPQKLKLNKTLIQQLSPQVLDLAIKQAKLQIQFRAYASLQQQIKDGQTIQQQKIQQFNRVKKDMEYNFKSLIRALEKNPNDLEILKSLKSNNTPNTEAFNVHEALSNYKVIMQKTLATAAQEEQSHTRLIQELNSKIVSLQKTRSNCEADLLKLKQQRAKHAEDKKEQIDKLRSQINEIKKNQQFQMQKIAKQSKQMTQALMKDHKLKEDKLRAQIDAERKKLQKLREENKRQEDKSKSDKFNNETQLMDMIATYDKDMLALTTTKNEAAKEYKKLTDELNNLKRHFAEIEEQRKREEAILEADRKRRQEWQLMERKKGEAATKIKQAYRLWKSKNKKKKKKKK